MRVLTRFTEPRHSGVRPEGYTRPRALLAVGVGLVVLFVLFGRVQAGTLAVNFSSMDRHFKIYSNYVQGVHGASYLGISTRAGVADQDGVAEFGFKQANLAGLCMIAPADVPGILGEFSFLITAGAPVQGSFDSSQVVAVDGDGSPIQLDAEGLLTGTSLSESIAVEDMFINSDLMRAYGNKISGLNLGQNATEVDDQAGLTWPNGGPGIDPQSGNFGLYSHYMNLSGLDGSTYGIAMSGSVELPRLRIRLLSGTRTQADCPTEAE